MKFADAHYFVLIVFFICYQDLLDYIDYLDFVSTASHTLVRPPTFVSSFEACMHATTLRVQACTLRRVYKLLFLINIVFYDIG